MMANATASTPGTTTTTADLAAIAVHDLTFSYGGPPILRNLTLQLPRGSRCLLVGANGAGKTTLLRILAGKRLVKAPVLVLGKDAYHDMPKGITYLGPEWAANPVVRRDVAVTDLLHSANAHAHPERRDELLQLLDIDLDWHMHQISDGERRRVQIFLGLIEPFDVLLMDEVTVDLDVLVRRNLLHFLRNEAERKKATIVYATHIFDGLGEWPTHVAHMRLGSIADVFPIGEFPELEQAKQKASNDSPLLAVVEEWLRRDAQETRVSRKKIASSETKWDQLSDMKTHGDKYYNYWNKEY